MAKILGGISIHSLRMEGDCATVSSQYTVGNFNPLPPYGGRRFQLDGDGNEYGISIHSLRMEGDSILVTHVKVYFIFQSTPSVWRETPFSFSFSFAFLFQSTPSVWRETLNRYTLFYTLLISIHSLRMEGDLIVFYNFTAELDFNPLPPYGGRRIDRAQPPRERDFNPLPPYGGRLRPSLFFVRSDSLFQSTPSVWRETIYNKTFRCDIDISIHSLRMEGDTTMYFL